jgi:hypothetical protein
MITLPDRSLLVQRFTPAALYRVALLNHEAFQRRLVEEVTRAEPTRAPVSILAVRSRSLLPGGLAEFLAAPELDILTKRGRLLCVGDAAPATLEFLCPGAAPSDADEVREQISEALGRLGHPVRWGWASAPLEALHPATLWGRCLDRFFGERLEAAEDLPHADPVMTRLSALCDIWAATKGGVLIEGEVGSGREVFGRLIHERCSEEAPFVVVKSATFDEAAWRTSVDRARTGTLYVRHLDALPPAVRAAFWDATGFRPMAGGEGEGSTSGPRIVIAIPSLRDRPLDVVPIAEHVLARCSGFEGLRKMKLTPPARSVLSKEWVGSVRELKNSLQVAALQVDSSGEVLTEHLSSVLSRFSGAPREADLRASLRNVERRSFLEALGRTNWNVTEAARVLGLPRRTIVYRMSRLGLKRPAPPG